MVQANDQIVVNIEAVVESTNVAPVFTNCVANNFCQDIRVNVPAFTALSQWDFPRSGEANTKGTATAQ